MNLTADSETRVLKGAPVCQPAVPSGPVERETIRWSTPLNSEVCASASVIILTRNAEQYLRELLPRLQGTTPAPRRVLFIDTRSTDSTAAMISEAGYRLKVIEAQDFGHGRTRNLGLDLCSDSDYVVYLTQDALPVGSDWLAQLLSPFARADVAVVFGRQIPRPGAPIAERFPRLFNYPETSEITVEPDIGRLGIKAVFGSNSFAAYNLLRLQSIGGFPENLPSTEEIAATLKLLRAGYARAYCSSAIAIHSHNLTLSQEFRRYFDVGVSLDCDSDLCSPSISTSGAGKSVLVAELRYARGESGHAAIIGVLVRTACKFAGFQLGRHHRLLPKRFCQWCSVHTYSWNRDSTSSAGSALAIDHSTAQTQTAAGES
jgi:rhamnosyltransferase